MAPNLFRYIWHHSKREQIAVLLVVLASLPFYFASFDVPKRIINEAIQGRAFAAGQATAPFMRIELALPRFLGGQSYLLTEGFQLGQISLLFALSLTFLTLVIINGAFKFYINMSKGILGERMLRRMRFELFALFLRFRPEDIRAVKPAEAATIIKDEVEPIGGFIGDAFIQPAFLGMQALTALLFILVQSVWLGLVALSIVLVQAFVIPALRREQIRLARERQIASRQLAGRIGEVVETAPVVHALDTGDYMRAEIGGRLGELFLIRVKLFRRKFAVKYLNNMLAQITPFFFYAVGGYLAITGAMNIGQLVAVIAAYRDLPPPVKELIDWDQERADVTVKYEQILAQFPPLLLPADNDEPAPAIAPDAPIRFTGFQVMDQRGAVLLEPLTLEIARPGHVALVGEPGGGRDIVARALGRQLSDARGKLTIGGVALLGLPDHLAAAQVAYVGSEPQLFSGSIRDNVVIGLRRRRPALNSETADAAEALRRLESLRSGNPPMLPSDDWLDLERAGVADGPQLSARAAQLLSDMGMGEDLVRFGLLGAIDPQADAALLAELPEARRRVAALLDAPAQARLVTQFDPERFNRNATLGENLLFGVAVGPRFAPRNLGVDPYMRSILQAEALLFPLASVGLRMAEGVAEIFDGLPPGHPLFERFSFVQADEMPELARIMEQARQRGIPRLAPEPQSRLVGLALSYIEQRHRMNVLDEAFETRILRARQSFRTYLPQEYRADVAFHDVGRVMPGASLRDSVLFGRIGYGVANAESKANELVRGVLKDLGLEDIAFRKGLDTQVGPAGRQMQSRHRVAIALARALVTRADTLVMDGVLGPFGAAEARAILDRVRAELTGRSLVVTLDVGEDVSGFGQVVQFEGPRLRQPEAGQGTSTDAGAQAATAQVGKTAGELAKA